MHLDKVEWNFIFETKGPTRSASNQLSFVKKLKSKSQMKIKNLYIYVSFQFRY